MGENPAGSPMQYISHWFPPLFVANKDNVKPCLTQWDSAQPCQMFLALWKPGHIIIQSVLRF